MRRRSLLATLAAGNLAMPAVGNAQGRFPDRPVRIIVPFLPGGGTDVWARMVAEGMQARLGQPVVIENRGGAGSIIGADLVAKATPDGYTLLYNSAAHVQGPVVLRQSPFHPIRDFAFIGQLGTTSLVFVVGPAVPGSITTLAEFVAWGRGQALNIGNFGPGSTSHAWGELLAREARLTATRVTYRGETQLIPALLAGEVHGGFTSTIGVRDMFQLGRLRALASAGRTRLPSLRERTPTLIELGYSDAFGFVAPNGLMAPVRTPPEVVERLSTAFRQVATAPETIRRLEAIDTIPAYLGPAEARAVMEQALQQWQALADALDLYTPA